MNVFKIVLSSIGITLCAAAAFTVQTNMIAAMTLTISGCVIALATHFIPSGDRKENSGQLPMGSCSPSINVQRPIPKVNPELQDLEKRKLMVEQRMAELRKQTEGIEIEEVPPPVEEQIPEQHPAQGKFMCPYGCEEGVFDTQQELLEHIRSHLGK